MILAVDSAESTLSIPDVKYVIDGCRTRVSCLSSSENIPCSIAEWSSKENLAQRAALAGRFQSGMCFRLCSKVSIMN